MSELPGLDETCSDLPLLLPEQETGGATVEVKFCGRTEHVPVTMTWEDYLGKRGLGSISHISFYDMATGRDFKRGATLEAMGYRGGKLAVGTWYVMGEMGPPPSSVGSRTGFFSGPATGTPPEAWRS
jgi:hypothetical protein